MSMTMKMNPTVGEPTDQTQKEPQEPSRHEESGKAAFLRCECLCCKGGIEFESSAFREKFRTNLLVFGQGIKCPHCGKITLISKNNNHEKLAATAIFKA